LRNGLPAKHIGEKVLLQIGLQTIPIVIIVILLRTQYSNKIKWLFDVIVFVLVTLFAFVTARWDIISYYLRILIPPIFIVAVYVAYRRIKAEAAPVPSANRRGENAGSIVLMVVFGWLNIQAISGYWKPEGSVNLSFPLQNGVYYVGGGGSSRWINNHNAYPPQDFAIDILELSAIGNPRISGGQSLLEKYAIYGNSIYSPCDGEVLVAVDEHEDQIPPNRDANNVAGNYVVIECFGVEIVLAHMKQGSVRVSAGDHVDTGDEIGAVGNSGNTTQPHLHIHAERGGNDREILNGEGVPITFENRFLVRNSLFLE
jgi:hypothetical protein